MRSMQRVAVVAAGVLLFLIPLILNPFLRAINLPSKLLEYKHIVIAGGLLLGLAISIWWHSRRDKEHVVAPQPDAAPGRVPRRQREYWGDAPSMPQFYGRGEEVGWLKRWATRDGARLVAITGPAGIGKTALATTVARGLARDFDYVIWRSLRHAPRAEALVAELNQIVSANRESLAAAEEHAEILRLIAHFREHRCLIILDGFEALMQAKTLSSSYRPGYELFGELLRIIGETHHRSSVLVTSQEKPLEVQHLEGHVPVYVLTLGDIGYEAGRNILKDAGLVATETEIDLLVRQLGGNPLALRLAGTAICDDFKADVSLFLGEGRLGIPDVHGLIDGQFGRLSSLEKDVVFWLAAERDAVSLEVLREDIIEPLSEVQLLRALQSLDRRSFVVRPPEGATFAYTLPDAILEYATQRLIDNVVAELAQTTSGFEPAWYLNRFALMKAGAKEHVRESQVQFLLSRVATEAQRVLRGARLIDRLERVVRAMQSRSTVELGYAGGNIVNLVRHLGVPLSGRDFSKISVWHADLRDVMLQGTIFAHTDLIGTRFTDTLGSVFSVAFCGDGRLLAAATSDGICIFRTADMQQTLNCRTAGYAAVWSVAFLPDGKTIAGGGEDRVLRLWDVESGCEARAFAGHSGWIRCVAASPDGRTIASGGDDRTIRVWDTSSGQCVRKLEGHVQGVRCLSYSPDGRHLASGGEDRVIHLWDVRTGALLVRIDAPAGRVKALAFGPAGRVLASGNQDQTVWLWDADTGESLAAMSGHTDEVRSVAFSRDGLTLASGSSDGTVRLWDRQSGDCIRTLHGHESWIWSVAFSPVGDILASGADDRSLRLWETHTGHCLRVIRGHTRRLWALAASPSGKVVASGGSDEEVEIWDLQTGELRAPLVGHGNWIGALAFSPDGALLASGSGDRTIRLWDPDTGMCRLSLRGHSNWVSALAFDEAGEIIVSGSSDESIRVWEIRSGQCRWVLHGHAGRVRTVAFCGSVVLSGGEDQSVRVWELQHGRCIRVFRGHSDAVRSVSAAGDSVASASDDGTIRLWHLETGECVNVLKGHDGPVRSIAVVPNGETALSGGVDGTVRVWQLSSGRCLQVLRGHEGAVDALALGPHEGDVFSTGSDGSIKVWHVTGSGCLATLRPNRPYEAMDITGVIGLTGAQRAVLRRLGAIGS